MKVFAVTEHSCAGMEDDTDVLVGLFFKKEDAVDAMNKRFDDWSVGNDYEETYIAWGLDNKKSKEKMWSEVEKTDDYITVTNIHDGWSCDHILLSIEEVEIQ